MNKCKGCDLNQVEKVEHDNACLVKKSRRNTNIAFDAKLVENDHSSDHDCHFVIPLSYLAKVTINKRRKMGATNEEANEQQFKSIIVHTLEKELIESSLESSEVTQELCTIRQELASQKSICFYTDGSLLNGEEDPEKRRMGLGWVAIKSEKEKAPRQELAEFKGAIRDWSSSTRAELAAIWSALLVAPRKAAVTICTDSAAAIQTIRA